MKQKRLFDPLRSDKAFDHIQSFASPLSGTITIDKATEAVHIAELEADERSKRALKYTLKYSTRLQTVGEDITELIFEIFEDCLKNGRAEGLLFK